MTEGRAYAGRSAEERTAERRAAFVAAGLELFGTRPFQAVTVAELVRESGRTRRAFYELFKDREELLRVVDAEAVRDPLLTVMARTPAPISDWPTARALLDAVLGFYASDPRRAHVAFVAVAGVSAEMEEHRRQAFRTLADALGALIGDRAGPDPAARRYAAMAFLGAASELLIDAHWASDTALDGVARELETLMRARFFSDA